MMRFVDILLSIPFLFIVLVLATKYSATVVEREPAASALFSWLVPARLVRGEVLTLRVRDFVSAATGDGRRRARRLVFRHLIPNALSVVIVNVTFQVADSILDRSPTSASSASACSTRRRRGATCSATPRTYVTERLLVARVSGRRLPRRCVVLACNLVGDALRDAFDVRLRRR